MFDFSKPWFAHGKQLLKGTVLDCELVAEFEAAANAAWVADTYNKLRNFVISQEPDHAGAHSNPSPE